MKVNLAICSLFLLQKVTSFFDFQNFEPIGVLPSNSRIFSGFRIDCNTHLPELHLKFPSHSKNMWLFSNPLKSSHRCKDQLDFFNYYIVPEVWPIIFQTINVKFCVKKFHVVLTKTF